MNGKITILPMFAKNKYPDSIEINTTSRSSTDWQVSPFYLGPVDLYDGMKSENMENAWQYSKVYSNHINENGNPTEEYWNWAKEGWNKKKADRYPMGKGMKPEYSYWNGEKLGYIEARKKIYIPLYSEAVIKTSAYSKLKEMYQSGSHLVFRDFDGYDHDALGMTLVDVLNNPNRKMGHAFVLKNLLIKEY